MKDRPFVAEIIGPSGAGKSTVSAVLNSRGDALKAGITVWRLPSVSLFASGLLSLPDLARLSFERGAVRKDELKQVIRLTAFRKLLKRHFEGKQRRRYNALFMDEGVVFALAKLRADIGRGFANRELERWETKMLDRWSGMLDAVIWLDAPDVVLIDRIRTREKCHRMKHEPDHSINEFLARYRAAYEIVISELARRNSIRELRFRTEDLDPAALAGEILKFTGMSALPEKISHTLIVARGIENEQAA